MAFPTVTGVLDDFNRSDGAIGSNWTKFASATDPTIDNNEVGVGSGTYVDALWHATAYGPSVEAQLKLKALLSGNQANPFWITLRATTLDENTMDGYQVAIYTSASQNSVMHVYRLDDFSFTQIGASENPDFDPDDTLGAWADDDDIHVYHHDGTSWSLVGTRTDATYADAGYTGFGIVDSSSKPGRVDDFIAGTSWPDPAETFPFVAGTPTDNQETSNATAHDVPYVSGIQAGDLLVRFAAIDGAGKTVSNWDGFTELKVGDASGAATVACGYKWATGAETGSHTVTWSSGERGTSFMYCIRNADTGTNPEASTGVSASAANPDPDSLTPSYGSADTLWFAVAGNDGDDTASAAPTNYTNLKVLGGDTSGAALNVAYRELNASSEDPGAFTMTSEQTFACTVAIKPIASASGGTDSATPVVYAASGTAPTGSVSATPTAASVPAAGTAPTVSVTQTATAASAAATGTGPTVAAEVTAAVASTAGSAPTVTVSATPTAGAAVATGTGPTAEAAVTAATIAAAGTAPTANIAATPTAGSAATTGTPPTVEAAVTAGSAPATGTAPTSSASDAPTAASVPAAGTTPTVAATAGAGTATATGTAPTVQATVTATTISAAGTAPTASATQTPTPGTATTTGSAPTAGQTDETTAEVVTATGTGPTAAATVTAASIAAAGTGPTVEVTVTTTSVPAAATSPTGSVSESVTAASVPATGSAPTSTVTQSPTPAVVTATGTSPTAAVSQTGAPLRIAVTNRKQLTVVVTNRSAFNITATNRARFNIQPENRKQLNVAADNRKQLQIGVT